MFVYRRWLSDPHRYGVDVKSSVKRTVNIGNVLEFVGLLSKTIGAGILAALMY